MPAGLSKMFSQRGAALFSGAVLSVLAALLLFTLTVSACQKQDLTPEQARVRKGQTLYALRCAACHNAGNPAKDGAVGPAIAGSGMELLEARVYRGEYPPGYTPKRATRVMQKLPVTPEELTAIHAYLNSP
jgi:mono/diheme cytochrome c family protein